VDPLYEVKDFRKTPSGRFRGNETLYSALPWLEISTLPSF
jgi:hypothetical protein